MPPFIRILTSTIGAASIVLSLVTPGYQSEWNAPLSDREVICHDQHCFTVEIADTPEERTKGLMFRELLEQDQGMLFVFDRPWTFKFWMKNTLIPLDMIRLDKSWRVVEIASADPCISEPCPRYGGTQQASYVLEINKWLAKKHNIQLGSTLQKK